MMEVFRLFVFVIMVFDGFCQEKYLGCSQLSSYCSSHGSVLLGEGSAVAPQLGATGKPGKRGQKGNKGDTGPIGPQGPPSQPCRCDRNAIEDAVTARVIGALKTCRVYHGDSCFYLLDGSGAVRNKAYFQTKCEESGANLANIYDAVHQKKIRTYIRSEIEEYQQVFLGMTYDPKAKVMRLQAGTTLAATWEWHPGYPNLSAGYELMFLAVRVEIPSPSQGIFNYVALEREYALCELFF